MRYGTKENIRVKKQIVDGLFSLLKKKAFTDISVSDLIKESSVSRSSYYRNFYNKEEIIDFYFDNIRDSEEITTISSNDLVSFLDQPHLITEAFISLYQEKDNLILLLENRLGDYIYGLFNERVMNIAGDMPAQSIDRYKLYFYSGAAYSFLVNWLKDGCIESPEVMGKQFIMYLKNGIQ
ncbi:hypothetical protein RZ54_09000 [Apilactobacillus kunkeei]|uniref:TetR-like C-terminal domain-containing protein n=1 Tax=Apilactobacillus kunkeei TaxID=148814 RepID=UPI0006C49FBB|nr:TetR-like C-terminal domain-containing protein [Apilactobacillus kunkeei]KOY74905.1 hypothetical protein RZ54_09000 [Apilactobacillus kunkeei]